jgi:muramoyltetrapeptide carboxypeptidase LdcA involved in peptidoglycan recycling
VRGGYGATRFLPDLDFKLIEKNPKIFIGYSDITALHLAIHQNTGLVTFHGPVAASTFSDYTKNHMAGVLINPSAPYKIALSPVNIAKGIESFQNRNDHARKMPRKAHRRKSLLAGGNGGNRFRSARYERQNFVHRRHRRTALPD